MKKEQVADSGWKKAFSKILRNEISHSNAKILGERKKLPNDDDKPWFFSNILLSVFIFSNKAFFSFQFAAWD